MKKLVLFVILIFVFSLAGCTAEEESATDSDGDGHPDTEDMFPDNPNEWRDSDMDGAGDNIDAFPNDPSETVDSDGDGVGNNRDAFPRNPLEWEEPNISEEDNDTYYVPPTKPDKLKDSDGDSVPDIYDEHPMGGGRMVVKYLEWNYDGQWTWELTIPSDVMTYYEQVPRPTWKGNYSYFSEFIDFNDEGVERLAYGLKNSIDEYGEEYNWSYYDEVMFVVSLVQQLHYSNDTLVGFDDYTKYPMQTLNDGTGDCEDMAILSAAILKKIGYDVKLLFLNIPDVGAHLAIAVWGHEDYEGDYWTKDNKKYYYIETTGTSDFGVLPEPWAGSTGFLIDV